MSDRRHGENAGPFRFASHPRPVTRRQFLGQGFITGAAWVMGPSLLGLFGRSEAARAQALDCGIGGGVSGMIPFMVFDLGGGASTSGSNVMVGANGSQLAPLAEDGYMKLGLPLAFTPLADPASIVTIDGTDPNLGESLVFSSRSALLRGIQLRASAATLQNVNGSIFCARSDNDTGNNPHNPMYGLAQAGLDGTLVTLIGTQSSDSGGRSDVPPGMLDPAIRPTKVDRPSDATGLVDTGELVNVLPNPADAGAVMLAAQNISDRKVGNINEQQLVKELIQCSFRQTTDLVTNFGSPDALDPEQDVDIIGAGTSIFQAGELNQSEFRKVASVMKLVAGGFAGAGTVEFGGYDYHDSTRATGERKDEIAGQAIGAALEYAARRGTPLVIYVLSDGSVASDGVIDTSADGGDKGIWKGDNSGTAGTFMLVYDPLARPTVPRTQVGSFRSSGSVDTDANAIANSVTSLAEAIVLNYLALHGQESRFGVDVVPGSSLVSEMGQLIAFAKAPSIP